MVHQQQADRPLQHQEAFESRSGLIADVPVGPHVSARLEHVQKPLHQIAFMVKVVVLTQSWVLPSNPCHLIKQGLIHPLQLHVGVSVVGHGWRSPERYAAGTITRNSSHQAETARPMGMQIHRRPGHQKDKPITAEPVLMIDQGWHHQGLSDQNGGWSAEGFELTGGMQGCEVVVAADRRSVDEYLREGAHAAAGLAGLEVSVVVDGDHGVGQCHAAQ